MSSTEIDQDALEVFHDRTAVCAVSAQARAVIERAKQRLRTFRAAGRQRLRGNVRLRDPEA